jgi:hypothetical protein
MAIYQLFIGAKKHLVLDALSYVAKLAEEQLAAQERGATGD